MKYLLIAPSKRGIKGFIECPPVGLGYLSTALKKAGHEVKIIDAIIDKLNNQQLVEKTIALKPDVVGINMFSTALESVKEYLVLLVNKTHYKRPTIVLGGPHVTGAPEHTFKFFNEVDYGIIGEGEIPVLELAEMLEGRRSPEYVHGLVRRGKNKIICNEGIQFENLDNLGLPDWAEIHPPKYFNTPIVGKNSCTIHFSRGCPFSCGFCVKFGTKVRWRSWEHIWSEIDYLNRNYGVRRFLIHDEGFTMFPEKVKEFCNQVKQKGVKYTFFSALGLRLNRVDDEMCRLMREVGFEKSFGVGIESAVPRVRQELINKRLTQEEITNGLEVLNRYGFEPVGNFILGYPGETKEEIKVSINWACKNKLLWGANFVPFIPLPGAPVVKKMMETGEMSPDYDFTQLNSQRVMYAPKGMTREELDNIRRWGVFKYNFRWKMLKHYLMPEFFVRAVITFIRLYAPNWILPKHWRRL